MKRAIPLRSARRTRTPLEVGAGRALLCGRNVDRSTNLVLFITLLLGCRVVEPREVAEPTREPLTVMTTKVRVEAGHAARRRFSGMVRSHRASQLGFERGGKLLAVEVDQGDRVQRGAPLARLDTRQLRVGERRARAGLDQARAQLGLSDLTASRLDRLARESFTPEQRADEARFGRDAARARVEELEAALAQIRVDLEKSVLRAPFDGVVTDRLVDEGTVVGAGTPVLRLLSDGGKEAFVGVPTGELGRLSPGSRHRVALEDREAEAQVIGLVDDVEPATRTVGVVLELPEDLEATDGEVVHLLLEQARTGEGAWLPLTALAQGLRGLWTVYALHRDEAGQEVVRREAVEILHVETERAFVRGTIEDGDRVIADGLHRVVPGQAVRPAPFVPGAPSRPEAEAGPAGGE